MAERNGKCGSATEDALGSSHVKEGGVRSPCGPWSPPAHSAATPSAGAPRVGANRHGKGVQTMRRIKLNHTSTRSTQKPGVETQRGGNTWPGWECYDSDFCVGSEGCNETGYVQCASTPAAGCQDPDPDTGTGATSTECPPATSVEAGCLPDTSLCTMFCDPNFTTPAGGCPTFIGGGNGCGAY